jgi:3-oxoacid CoA-transferase subunit A
MPQGTLAEKMRAGGAGIPAFYTPAGVGTLVSEGGLPWRYNKDGSIAVSSPAKESRVFNGVEYILEESISTDYALIHAAVADRYGNCVFNKAAQNFNPVAGMAGRITIVEAEKVVEVGELAPEEVHLSSIYVHRIVELTPEQAATKLIEKRTVSS